MLETRVRVCSVRDGCVGVERVGDGNVRREGGRSAADRDDRRTQWGSQAHARLLVTRRVVPTSYTAGTPPGTPRAHRLTPVARACSVLLRETQMG